MIDLWILIEMFLIPVVIGLVIFRWYREYKLLHSVTRPWRGTRSERQLIMKLLKDDIPPVTLYHDLYVDKHDGQYSQIDAVVLTKVGVIVVEVKDYSGWIFGKGYQEYWTQVLAYGKRKTRFYNPVMQNRGHMEALRKLLAGKADVPFFSVIAFAGSCTLKDVSRLPDDTYVIYAEHITQMIDTIILNNPQAHYNDKYGVVNALNECVANGADKNIVRRHVQNLRQMYR